LIIRIWKVRIKEGMLKNLKHFAMTESQPMFNNQEGCLGVLFTLDGNLCATTTLWKDRESIEALKTSKSYIETVDKIVATGMLEGESSIEIFNCFGGYLETDAIKSALPS